MVYLTESRECNALTQEVKLSVFHQFVVCPRPSALPKTKFPAEFMVSLSIQNFIYSLSCPTPSGLESLKERGIETKQHSAGSQVEKPFSVPIFVRKRLFNLGLLSPKEWIQAVTN